MTEFKDGVKYPTWGDMDSEDPKIDNLITYILEKKPLHAIKWQQKPYKDMNERVSNTKNLSGGTQEMVEPEPEEEGDTPMITLWHGIGKRKGSNRKFMKMTDKAIKVEEEVPLMLTQFEEEVESRIPPLKIGGKRKRKIYEVGGESVSQQCRGRHRLTKRKEEIDGETTEDDFVPVRRCRSNMAGDLSTRPRMMLTKVTKFLHRELNNFCETLDSSYENLSGKMNIIGKKLEIVEKDVGELKSETEEEERMRQSKIIRLGSHDWVGHWPSNPLTVEILVVIQRN